jgi:precorrin-6B methylase 2
LRTLGRHAFERDDLQSSQEALRCLANALLLVPSTRQMLVDLGYGPKAAQKFKAGSALPCERATLANLHADGER